jgi:hypothetical protein
MSSLPSPPRAQSANAIPGGTSKKDSCTRCGQPVAQYYFRVNGAMHCMPCAKEMRSARPEDESATYRRALRFGAIAALGAFILYSVYGIVTGWRPGYFSLFVGWAVAEIMMAGSHKVGGRRYQLTAILLTYMAVSMSAVPIALSGEARWRAAARAQQHTVDLAEEQRRLEQEFGTSGSAPVPSNSKRRSAQRNSAAQNETPAIRTWQGPGARPSSQISPAAIVGSLVALGLLSPILALLEPTWGGIRLLLLLAGMVIAWRITAATRHEIIGPFRT